MYTLTTEEHTKKLPMKDIIQNAEEIFFTGIYNSQNCFYHDTIYHFYKMSKIMAIKTVSK